ncbi:hypothetical protein PIB30_063193 [Stylosanthes scabra]|uniref:Secreted protein n=1 Tax=Stylosanthes scabra TaxID=79078 RepID=A0ABU6UPC0_9FABA|nr:hypothetical protein [Stylosanthes scabra]
MLQSPPMPRSASTLLPSSRFVACLTLGPLCAAHLSPSLPLRDGALNIARKRRRRGSLTQLHTPILLRWGLSCLWHVELFGNVGDANWASDVTEARRERDKEGGGGGGGSGVGFGVGGWVF